VGNPAEETCCYPNTITLEPSPRLSIGYPHPFAGLAEGRISPAGCGGRRLACRRGRRPAARKQRFVLAIAQEGFQQARPCVTLGRRAGRLPLRDAPAAPSAF